MTAITDFVDEVKASMSWIVPISVLTTAILGRWPLPTHADAHRPHKNPSGYSPSHTQPFKTRRTKSAMFVPGGDDKLDAHDLQREKNGEMNPQPLKTAEPKSKPESPFMNLPLEVRLAILEYCAPIPFERRGADSLDTFLTLLRVSKAIQYEAYVACLPHIPLALWTKKGVHSFRALLYRRGELGCLVRYLWIGTGKYDDEELGWAVDILREATQLKSFACGEFLLARAVNAKALAPACGRVTLMNVEKGVEYEAGYVTHLRLCAGTYSTQEKFPDVTSLCFNARRRNAVKDERMKMEYEAVDKWVENLEGFAMIERDGKRASPRGLGLRFKVRRDERPDMYSISLPARWTEWDIWSADVVGAGVWDICRVKGEPAK
ncbi:hypothetical protein P691DRAFT_671788 [Macrolepiota fuliginosa MF-IS2]|uniref:Uncharacterized protein n=1 Tax=Macrolepiota fuliginosa MF-IS2 TaxID=1400762 RepID=A0A9P5XCG5_9AGAR|nr:hypothetical protein P691DRAFT_671788 [Macrolepiota fuliginosa MF-IS2]